MDKKERYLCIYYTQAYKNVIITVQVIINECLQKRKNYNRNKRAEKGIAS